MATPNNQGRAGIAVRANYGVPMPFCAAANHKAPVAARPGANFAFATPATARNACHHGYNLCPWTSRVCGTRSRAPTRNVGNGGRRQPSCPQPLAAAPPQTRQHARPGRCQANGSPKTRPPPKSRRLRRTSSHYCRRKASCNKKGRAGGHNCEGRPTIGAGPAAQSRPFPGPQPRGAPTRLRPPPPPGPHKAARRSNARPPARRTHGPGGWRGRQRQGPPTRRRMAATPVDLTRRACAYARQSQIADATSGTNSNQCVLVRVATTRKQLRTTSRTLPGSCVHLRHPGGLTHGDKDTTRADG